MFFPKLFVWLKGHWKLLAIIGTIALVAIAGLQTLRNSRLEREHHELKGKLSEQVDDQNKLRADAETAQVKRDVERAEEKTERARLEASIKKAVDEGLAAKRELKEEKEKTAKLQPTMLVAEINQRIGDEASITGAGLYLFTRVGAERTLNRFKDGEFCLSEYNKQTGIIKDYIAKSASFDTDLASCDEERVGNLTGWDDCRETLVTAQEDIMKLEKIKKSGVWRGRKQGAVLVLIIVGGLKLLGAW